VCQNLKENSSTKGLNSQSILEGSRISAKSIAEQPGIPRKQGGYIIHEDQDMRKLSMKWVPKCLNADQTPQQCQVI
jgi:hypothetical protein